MESEETLAAVSDTLRVEARMRRRKAYANSTRAKKVPYKHKKGTVEFIFERRERDRLRKAAKRPMQEAVLNDGYCRTPKFMIFGNPPL